MTKYAFTLSIIVMLLVAVNSCFAANSSEYQLATKFYQSKNYTEAAIHFDAAFSSNPKNVVALYYSGYSYYLAKNRVKAIEVFWNVTKHFPNSKQALRAKRMLKSIDPEYYSKVNQQPDVAGLTKTVKSNDREESPKEIVKSLIVVPRPKSKLPAVTPSFVTSIEDLLVGLPLPVLRMLKHRRAKVTIVPSLVEADFRMQNTRPRGYNSGSTWKNSHAFCHGKNLFISQYRLNSRTGNYETTDTEVGSIRHEAGHAVDYCLGYASQKEKFRHAYRLEAARVPAAKRGRLDYFLQLARGGPSETFAELCCARFGGETDKYRQETCGLIKKYFVNTDKILGELLDIVDKKYGDK